ncbi:type I-MYXAN CRISPR-associated protein Cas6/Cmx6 [Thiocapsa imhoffii]|uniref:Type I-MYXAN CRISPR-associated protein Cas6/Cmx6 n=1 Tax=Thiocapsa imhoffii TaxID=382777 RepID=A0A9X1B7R8_9GAMM|nr:type I-MYXAN CRISPR-associated protein Cas6/Cmx6 [Thiocapsa imhoffii]MBK1644134.1 type I-MYXAN CRISPR-associated protein Cas6/Cmx6 [Thiocapsa imhoffii]
MKFWNDDAHPEQDAVPDDVSDLVFAMRCKCLPVDHAYLLATSLTEAIPWIAREPGLAVHSIHVAGSQNGWERPDHGTDSYLMVPRRTKLVLRVPRHRIAELLSDLPGTHLRLGDETLTVGEGKLKPLCKETTLFARYVALAPGTDLEDESAFLEAAAQALGNRGIRLRKALCGKTHPIATPQGPLPTRSLLVAGLTLEESIRLQQQGLGRQPLLGCGIFIPHKGIDAIKPAEG